MYFFTADEHYGHANILNHCKRPYRSVEEMDAALIQLHNSVVGENDTVVHAGDFCFGKKRDIAEGYLKQLNGNHIVLKGSHDYWLKDGHEIWEKKIEDEYVVVCHYAMRVWPRSHFNSWQLYGHSHCRLEPLGKQWDVGVDNNEFTPVSFQKLKTIMAGMADNSNLLMPEIESVTDEVIEVIEEAILNEAERVSRDYRFEYCHLCGNLRTDSRKLYELARMNRNYDILMNAWQSFGLSSNGSLHNLLISDSIRDILNFTGAETPRGKALCKFLVKCLQNGTPPEPREMEKAMNST